MSIEEFVQKAEWEGGFEEAIFGYGLKETDLDVKTGPFYEAVKELAELAPHIRDLIFVLELEAEEFVS